MFAGFFGGFGKLLSTGRKSDELITRPANLFDGLFATLLFVPEAAFVADFFDALMAAALLGTKDANEFWV